MQSMAAKLADIQSKIHYLRWVYGDLPQNWVLVAGHRYVRFPITNEALSQHFRWNYLDEFPVLYDALSRLKQDDVVLDVGANVGLYSCMLGKYCNHVLAVEPQPANCEQLRENMDLNNVQGTVEEVALGDSSGHQELAVESRGVVAGAGRGAITEGIGEATIPVAVQRGDEILSENGLEPDIVKIDAEGAELSVLHGLTDTFNAQPPREIYVEAHHSSEREDVMAILTEVGFSVSVIHERGEEVFIRGTLSN